MTDDPTLDALASKGVELELPKHVLAAVADLTLRLHLVRARSAGAILTPAMMRSYRERSESEQDGMCAAVLHVVRALVLLDVIEPPEHGSAGR
jgi:hypothetical protein